MDADGAKNTTFRQERLDFVRRAKGEAMPRYIDVEDAIKVADNECGEFRGIFARIKERLESMPAAVVLEAMPAADIVEVVRCKDCRFFDNTTDFTYCKRVAWVGMDEDDYCSFAEWKDDASHPFADDVMMGDRNDAEIH